MVSSNKAINPNSQPINEGGTKANLSARPEGPRPAANPKPEGLPALSPAFATVLSAPSIGVNLPPSVARPAATPKPEPTPNASGTSSQSSSSPLKDAK
jgi:hypothetical protein